MLTPPRGRGREGGDRERERKKERKKNQDQNRVQRVCTEVAQKQEADRMRTRERTSTGRLRARYISWERMRGTPAGHRTPFLRRGGVDGPTAWGDVRLTLTRVPKASWIAGNPPPAPKSSKPLWNRGGLLQAQRQSGQQISLAPAVRPLPPTSTFPGCQGRARSKTRGVPEVASTHSGARLNCGGVAYWPSESRIVKPAAGMPNRKPRAPRYPTPLVITVTETPRGSTHSTSCP